MSCPVPTSPPDTEEVEQLADMLHAEQLEHGNTRERLAEALRELERLRAVEKSARGVVLVTTTCVFSPREEAELMRRLGLRLLDLAYALAELQDVSDAVADAGAR